MNKPFNQEKNIYFFNLIYIVDFLAIPSMYDDCMMMHIYEISNKNTDWIVRVRKMPVWAANTFEIFKWALSPKRLGTTDVEDVDVIKV